MTSQTFASHESPVIADYTPDYLVVGAEVVSLGDDDIVKTVTYTADEQKLTVTFIDDTTGETLKMVIKSGPSSADTGYNTASDIKNYADAHYELVSDSTNGANLVFDHDANIEQHYAVHLKHHTNHRTDTKSVHRTIHYTYAMGRQQVMMLFKLRRLRGMVNMTRLLMKQLGETGLRTKTLVKLLVQRSMATRLVKMWLLKWQ